MVMTHLLVLEDDEGRREFVLNSPIYSMGKDPQCDVRLVSRFVSRHHATLLQLPNDDSNYYYRIVDGNLQGKTSANGLMINGRRFQAHNLQNEDEIVFGPQVRAIYYRLDEPTITPPPLSACPAPSCCQGRDNDARGHPVLQPGAALCPRREMGGNQRLVTQSHRFAG